MLTKLTTKTNQNINEILTKNLVKMGLTMKMFLEFTEKFNF